MELKLRFVLGILFIVITAAHSRTLRLKGHSNDEELTNRNSKFFGWGGNYGLGSGMGNSYGTGGYGYNFGNGYGGYGNTLGSGGYGGWNKGLGSGGYGYGGWNKGLSSWGGSWGNRYGSGYRPWNMYDRNGYGSSGGQNQWSHWMGQSYGVPQRWSWWSPSTWFNSNSWFFSSWGK